MLFRSHMHGSHTYTHTQLCLQELKEIYEEQGLPRPAYSSRNSLAQLLAEVRADAALQEELKLAVTEPEVCVFACVCVYVCVYLRCVCMCVCKYVLVWMFMWGGTRGGICVNVHVLVCLLINCNMMP